MDDPVQGDQLRSIVERIERLEEEKKTISDDIKEVYAEAKAHGYDVKVLRKAVALRKRDANERAEEEAILDLYMQAIGDLADTPLGRAAAPGFSSRSAMARSTPAYPERVSRPVTDLETSKDTQARQISAPAGNGADQLVADDEFPEPDATPAGAVVAIRSGATAGETAADEGEASPFLDEPSSAPIAPPAADAKPRFTLPPAKALRPNCLKPEACAGVGRAHCFTCTQAANEARQPALDEEMA